MDVTKFQKKPILGILRGAPLATLEPLIETVIDAGLETLEITMNTPDAALQIKKAKAAAKSRLTLGAGTVLNMEALKAALDAGATFIVTPVIVKEVIEYCVKHKIPVFPGALTPNEIYAAWQLGATMVKVFPAKLFGPQYFKEVKAPLNNIKLMAVGGVTPENLQQYLANGADAVAFGTSVFKTEWLQSNNFAKIQQNIINLIKTCHKKNPKIP